MNSVGHNHIGQILDRKYRITRLVGAGGMGTVYEAEHILLSRKVAVKVMHPEYVSNPESVERFFREAKAASAIGHPNIIDIHDVGREDDDTIFIVMELLSGRSLDNIIDDDGGCTIEHSVHIALQILSALEAAHEKGIIHRDLKADNVFLSLNARGREEIKLLDFGIAKIEKGNTANLGLTKEGNVVGTPYYLSPEQARGGKFVDLRMDIWGVGVLMYEMLSGSLPFKGENYNEILSNILMTEATPLKDLAPAVPDALIEVVARAMAKDPEGRFTNAGEMMTALTPFHSIDREDMSTIVFETLNLSSGAHRLGSGEGATAQPGKGKDLRNSDPNAQTMDLDLDEMQYADSISAPIVRRSNTPFVIAAGVGMAAIAAILGFALVGMEGGEDIVSPTNNVSPPTSPGITTVRENLTIDKSEVTLEIAGVPGDGTITLDGLEVTSPVTREASDSPVLLKVEAPGREPFEKALTLQKDQMIRVEMKELEKSPSEMQKKFRKKSRGSTKRKKPGKKKVKNWESNPFG